jgi:hypothetical protein
MRACQKRGKWQRPERNHKLASSQHDPLDPLQMHFRQPDDPQL